MLPVSLNITLMLSGYLLVMGYLGLGLLIMRRRPIRRWRRAQRIAPAPGRHGWPALVRQVAGTAIGGYVVLVAVAVGYYHGVTRLGGQFLLSAVTGPALLIGLTLPAFLLASWVATRRRK
ncbi:hypothetical protein QQM39_10370 [Streptomyces sp. DT2A-34]|uniref:DUF6256 family protein n=1 Tax=Streptomyces sp. DT2A-34 TaxID=3051182 RepID=UPI00265B7B3A|nr:DUF6256 family protein [Streptomyces sp. DT2A-34]MDO0911245.1 hypothetical protein [Streptomyces sp. DT2A-34]